MIIFVKIAALAVAAQSPVADGPGVFMAQDRDASFGTQELVDGRNAAAIRAIGDLDGADPAKLINLAIAHARRGEAERARDLFETVLTQDERVELETAEGRWVDSRALARKGIAMLDSGGFASKASIASR